MHVSRFTLAREELISDTFPLAFGRRVVATLETNPGVPAGPAPAERDSLQLIVESRANRDEPFAELARSSVISEAGTVGVELPAIEAPQTDGGLPPPPPVARLRVIHTGRMLPRFTVQLVGL